MAVFCGIDWAEGHHDIVLVDGDGTLVAKRRINETLDGFAELTAMLADAGDSAEAPIPVAIETPRGLLVAALRATARPIYPINPLAVAPDPPQLDILATSEVSSVRWPSGSYPDVGIRPTMPRTGLCRGRCEWPVG